MAVGAVDDDSVAQGNVEAVLNDGGRDQDIGFMAHKGHHHFFQLALGHLPVTGQDPGLRQHLLDFGSHLVDRLNPVVDKVGLPAALQFVLQRRLDQLLVVGRHHSLDGHAVFRRGLNHAHIAQPHHGHVQGAWDGGGRHGQHVHFFLKLLEALLVADTEALLFIHHHQSQILELDVLGKNAVRADQDVYFALLDLLRSLLVLPGRAEAAHHLDGDRKGGKAALEVLKVLEGQDCGGRKHGHLLVVLHSLERGAHSDLGLAITDIAAQQAVHGQRRFHVLLDLFNGLELVVGLVELKGVFELALPLSVNGEGVAFRGLAHGIELKQLIGHIFHGLLDARLGLGPSLAAQPAQRRPDSLTGTVFLDEIEPRERDIQLGPLCKFQHHELTGNIALLNLLEALVHADAVLHVHHVVAHGQIAEVRYEGRGLGLLPQRPLHHHFRIVKQVACAKEHQARLGQYHAIRNGSAHDGGGREVSGEVGGFIQISLAARSRIAAAHAERHLVFREDVRQALHLAGVGCRKDHAPAFTGELLDLVHHGGDRAVEAGGGLGEQFNRVITSARLSADLRVECLCNWDIIRRHCRRYFTFENIHYLWRLRFTDCSTRTHHSQVHQCSAWQLG